MYGLIWVSPALFIDLIFEICEVVFTLAFPDDLLFAEPPRGGDSGPPALSALLHPAALGDSALTFWYRIVLCPIVAKFHPVFVPS